MREGPKFSKIPETKGIEGEPVLAHRIEQWDILEDISLTIPERKEKLIRELDKQVDVLHEIQEKNRLTNEELFHECEGLMRELLEDIRVIHTAENTEESLAGVVRRKQIEYKGLLDEFKRIEKEAKSED